MLGRALAALLFATAAVAAPASSPLLGIVSGPALVRVDPETLDPRLEKQIALGSVGCAARGGGEACWSTPPWSYSPDRSRLVVARNEGHFARSLRLVAVGRMAVTADVPVRGGSVGALAWVTPRRILALHEDGDSERQWLLAVDPAQRRVISRRRVGGSVLGLARAPRQLVLLVGASDRITSARLAVADRGGALRSVKLARVLAGGSGHGGEVRRPGVAVDPMGRRAFVVARTLVAEIDLATLAVSYHPRGAWAKTTTGYVRAAA